jgi:hypothetical protein
MINLEKTIPDLKDNHLYVFWKENCLESGPAIMWVGDDKKILIDSLKFLGLNDAVITHSNEHEITFNHTFEEFDNEFSEQVWKLDFVQINSDWILPQILE